VKGNQSPLQQDRQAGFDTSVALLSGMGCPPKDFRTTTTTTKDHGRLEIRTLTTSSQLNDFLDWPFLQQVFKMKLFSLIYNNLRLKYLLSDFLSEHQT